MTQAAQNPTPQDNELRDWLLGISRDEYALITTALKGFPDGRDLMLEMTQAQSEANRAEYVARVARDLAEIVAALLIAREDHGNREEARMKALEAHQQKVLKLEQLAPLARVTPRTTPQQP